MTPFKVRKEILVNAPINAVWNALTDLETMGRIMFNSNVRTDWSPGSEITFSGEHQGTVYHDKGEILIFDIEQEIAYTYLSSFSGLEDRPENYSRVSLQMAGMDDGETTLTLVQENLPSKEAAIHADGGWGHALSTLKEIVEG
jgi:uncharacterized protein YndB with AHSA1/START domain